MTEKGNDEKLELLEVKPIKKVNISNNMSNNDSFLQPKTNTSNDLKGRSRDYKVESDDDDAEIAASFDDNRKAPVV